MSKGGWLLGLGALAGGAAFLWSRKAKASGESQGAPDEVGMVSFYGPGLEGNLTANGEHFDPGNTNDLTAAHPRLPFNTVVDVVDVATGRHVAVRINDRGPYAKGRILDLSEAAARALGIIERGAVLAELRVVP